MTNESRRRWSGERLAIAGFLAPFGLLFALTYLAPTLYAVYKSTLVIRREGTFGAPHEVFGGFENYTRALGDSDFIASIERMLLFGVVQYPIMIALALALALLLDSGVAPMRRFFRLAFFVPYAVPVAVAAIMWGFLYAPGLSPIVGPLRDLGITIDFLSPGTVLWSIANMVTWTWCGFNMLILFAALQAIDPDLSRAARVDGANAWQIAWHIKIPLIRPALVLTTVFSIIGVLQLFTEPQVLRFVTGSVTSTYTPSLVAFTEASANHYNYAAAVAVILATAIGIFSFAFLWLVRRDSR